LTNPLLTNLDLWVRAPIFHRRGRSPSCSQHDL